MNVIVERAGFLTTVQDLGRTGFRASGVSLGGALDSHALRVANLLVGNEAACAGLELTMGNVRLRFEDERLVAWCGGEVEAPFARGRSVLVRAGEEVSLTMRHGRAWLAISGGLGVPPVLGSRSTDLHADFGGLDGRALSDGDPLPLGETMPHTDGARSDRWFAPNEWSHTTPRHPFLRIIRGADADRFDEASLDALVLNAFEVLPDSDRMGARLEGVALTRPDPADLLSEPVAPGTIQVPPSGDPILLLGDCQTIGGYPKIAHVITVDLPAAAQLQAGDSVRFVEINLADAQRLLVKRERDLEMFRAGLELRTRWS